jgi:hypothetical protein
MAGARVIRRAGLLVVLALGGLYGGGSSKGGGAETAGAVIGGVLIALLLLAVVAFVVYHSRRRRSPFSDALLSAPALVIAAVLIVVLNTSRYVQHETAVQEAKPSLHGNAVEREKALRESDAWANRIKPALEEYVTGVKADPKFDRQLGTQGNSPAVRATAARQLTRFRRVRTMLRAQAPPDVPELRGTAAQLDRLLGLWVDAYAHYVAGLKQNVRSGKPLASDRPAIHTLELGDASIKRANALGTKLGHTLQRELRAAGVPG